MIEPGIRQALRIRVGRLLDGTGGPAVEDAALLVLDGRIAAVGSHDAVAQPEDARTLDLPGTTALPGLMDAHVHVTLPPTSDPLGTMAAESDEDLVVRGSAASERMVRAGITTAYDCGARGMTAYAIRDGIARGLTLGPRLLVSGRAVTQTGGHCHFFGGEADGVVAVRETVRKLIEDEGADGIKIMATGGGMTSGTDSRHASYSIEELAAAADEAHRLGKKVTSHAHGVPGIDNASKAGIDSIQHCTMLGENWEWAFNETVARGMVERGTRAIPTISAGTRYEVETGKDINKLQPNPGRMTQGGLVGQRQGASRRRRDARAGHGCRDQPHRLRRGAVHRARGVGRSRHGGRARHPLRHGPRRLAPRHRGRDRHPPARDGGGRPHRRRRAGPGDHRPAADPVHPQGRPACPADPAAAEADPRP